MPKALVVVDTYRWNEVDDDGKRKATHEASRGEVIEVPDAEFERGRSLNALMDPGDRLTTLQRVSQLEAEAVEAERVAREKRAEATRARAVVRATDAEGAGTAFALADIASAQGRVIDQDELIAHARGIRTPAGAPVDEGRDLRAESKSGSGRRTAAAESGGGEK